MISNGYLNKTIILAAGQGQRLRPLTDAIPKCMVNLAGRPLLSWQIDCLHAAGISDIVVVRGYQGHKIDIPGVIFRENPFYDSTNMVQSLWSAEDLFDDGFIMAYSDILYRPSLIARLRIANEPISVIVDLNWRAYWELRFEDILSDAETLRLGENNCLIEIGQKPMTLEDIQGQYVGLVAFRDDGVKLLRHYYELETKAYQRGEHFISPDRLFPRLYMTDLIHAFVRDGIPVHGILVRGGWLEIDSVSDLNLAEGLVQPRNNLLSILR